MASNQYRVIITQNEKELFNKAYTIPQNTTVLNYLVEDTDGFIYDLAQADINLNDISDENINIYITKAH